MSKHRVFEQASRPDGVRHALEPRFGVAFDAVRVHTGAGAESLAQGLSARAFTFGRDIWLVHVLQQT